DPPTPVTSLFLHSSDSSERPPPSDLYLTIVARWRSRVVLHSSSPSSPTNDLSPTHDLSPVVVASPAPCRIAPAPPGIPHRLAILVLPGQEIPVGRPYHPSSLDLPSETSSHHSYSYAASSSSLFAGPSCKRCRSTMTLVTTTPPTLEALSPVHTDLLLPYKRIRDSSVAVSSKEDIDFDVMDDIEVDIAAETATAEAAMTVKVDTGFEADV
nr:hypothetical protein [Tanacetum cinerariifolium]